MPINRNALLRHQIIDRCLRNRGRRWTWKDILDVVNDELFSDNPNSSGIKKTTLYEDLKDIEYRIYKLEIERIKEGRTIYMRYADPNASISTQPLSASEMNLLRAAVAVISRFKGIPQFEWVHKLIPLLESKLGLKTSSREIISFESNIDYEGTQHIQLLYNAILLRRALRITYQSFKSQASSILNIHPQYLKQYNSRWFLMSYIDEWGDKPQVHALDRILHIEESGHRYMTKDRFNWDDYFAEMIGVSRPSDESVEVKIVILDSLEASYIKTKPLHQSQKKIRKQGEWYETSISVIPNIELEKLILSFGENIKIKSPEWLKDRLRHRVYQLHLRYLSD